MGWTDIKAIWGSEMKFALASPATGFSVVKSGLHSACPVIFKSFSFLWGILQISKILK